MATKVTATLKKADATAKVEEAKTTETKATETKAVETKAEAKKPAAKAETKKATKTVAKTAEKATKTVAKTAEKATKTVAKTAEKATKAVKEAATKKAPKTAITLEYADKKYTTENLEKIATDVWVYDYGKKASDLKKVELYVKPYENRVYYVFNGDVVGSFQI